MATVVLPRSLVALFPGAERRVTLDADTVADAIDGLDARWPGVRDRLRDEIGLRPHIHVIPAVSGG
jgi:sulfur-carrier protein